VLYSQGIDAAAGGCYILVASYAPNHIISIGDLLTMRPPHNKWSIAWTVCLSALLSFLACMMRVICLKRCCKVNTWTLYTLGFAPTLKPKKEKSKGEEK
jgi:hypothetical protein